MQESGHDTEDIRLTNFEKFIAVVCWWQPLVALVALFFGSAPRELRRHAKWSVLTVVVAAVAAVALGLLFAAAGFLFAGERGASAGVLVAGIGGLLQFVAALINTLAVITARGPYFASAGNARRN